MQESEVIIVDGICSDDYDAMVESSVRYAIISMPFTVDRMHITEQKQRVLNIAKGKIAESLFKYFCNMNNIDVDFTVCSTPFWEVDKRDFVLNKSEWDIKNNFIYCCGNLLSGYNYVDLPALIPNRFLGDQWSKRNQQLISETIKTEYLFTFLKNSDITNGKRGSGFLEVLLSNQQIEFLKSLYLEYNGRPQINQPFTEEWFWKKLQQQGSSDIFRLYERPYLIITAYANQDHWELFKDTGPNDKNNNYQTYLDPTWYEKKHSGACNFMGGILCTKITNATVPISKLPSFLSLFSRLKKTINCGRIKKREE